MPVTASRLFDFFAERPECLIERHEIESAAFSDLRRSLRATIVSLSEGGDWDAKEWADRLRTVISEWLTVPVRFDDAVLRLLTEMGEPRDIDLRWGRDIRSHIENARSTAQDLMTRQNPLRTAVSNTIQKLLENGLSVRIFCHRRSREHFDSLTDEFGLARLPASAFLHSVAEYRETEPFDVLIKVGPLRSRGWGAAPDALLTAPRFGTLIQMVWTGCGDEPGFGYDPVAPPTTDGPSQTGKSVAEGLDRTLHLKWAVTETRFRDEALSKHGYVPDVDDLEVYTQLARAVDVQRATLVQVDDAHGILYPPHSRVLSYDADTLSIDHRLPGETLQEGMYVILPIVDDMRLAGLQAEEGQFSRTWKERLRAEFSRDPVGLAKRLRDAGLTLLQLRSRIEHWCRPASTVIHAPQQIRHFEILIKVLGLDFDATQGAYRRRAAWWQFAWDEVRRARGEAIQTGVNEQQIVDAELLDSLRELGACVQAQVGQDAFEISIPASQRLRGVFRFFRVRAIEEGFQVPPGELKMLCELSRSDQWRA